MVITANGSDLGGRYSHEMVFCFVPDKLQNWTQPIFTCRKGMVTPWRSPHMSSWGLTWGMLRVSSVYYKTVEEIRRFGGGGGENYLQ